MGAPMVSDTRLLVRALSDESCLDLAVLKRFPASFDKETDIIVISPAYHIAFEIKYCERVRREAKSGLVLYSGAEKPRMWISGSRTVRCGDALSLGNGAYSSLSAWADGVAGVEMIGGVVAVLGCLGSGGTPLLRWWMGWFGRCVKPTNTPFVIYAIASKI